MAHEYAKIILDNVVNLDGENRDDYLEFITTFSHDLAEAMLDEHSKRQDKSRPEAINDFKVDWSQAPDWANWWAMDCNGYAYWHSCSDMPFTSDEIFEIPNPQGHTSDAPLFNYQGDWKKSLRKRPEAIAEKTVVIREGGYYHDHVNFEYYKLSEGKWFKIKSILDPVWIECDQPATTWLVENDTYR